MKNTYLNMNTLESASQRRVSAAATEQPFTFASADDTPPGVYYLRNVDGFKASAPARTPILAAFLSLLLLGIGAMILNTAGDEKAPIAFFIVLSIVFAIALVLFTFFAIGREQIEVKADVIHIQKTVFGIGFSQKLHLHKIIRAQIVQRSGMGGIGIMPMMTGGFNPTGTVGGHALELETDTHIKTLGTNLKAKHLYYMRYLIIEAVKASRAKPAHSM